MKMKGINSKKRYRINPEDHAGKERKEKKHRVKFVNNKRIGYKKEGM